MIDSPQLLTAAVSAPPPSARSSSGALRKSGDDANDFALALARSTTETDGTPEAHSQSAHPTAAERGSEDEDIPTTTTLVDVTIDIAAMISLKTAENVPPPLSVGAEAFLDAGEVPPQLTADIGGLVSSLAPGEARSGAPRAISASPHAAPKSPALPSRDEADIATPPGPVMAIAEAESDIHRAPAAIIENPVDFSAGLPRADRSDTASKPAKSSVSAVASAAQQFDELTKPSTQPTEALSPGNAGLGIVTAAGGMHIATNVPATISLVPTHTESPAWSKDFGQHLIRLAIEGQQAAEIHLNPPDWGPIHVSIDMSGEDASLRFAAEHTPTREALENALPRLRELFAANNLNIISAEIDTESQSQLTPQQFADSQGQRFHRPQNALGDGRTVRSFAVDADAPATSARMQSTSALSRVDLFA